MATAPQEYLDYLKVEYPESKDLFIVAASSADKEIKDLRSEEHTIFLNADEHHQWVPGMATVQKTVSDVIVERLQKIEHVSAILMGRSGDVYHVWTMITNWTSAGRKAVYAAQRELVKSLEGLNLDFYVVAADHNEMPNDLVSGIPVVFERRP